MDSQKNKATDLIRLAYEAQKRSYSPYSGFQTGAALETAGGKVYQGCNIENAGYTPSNCAERTAFFKAVSEGERSFTRIAVVGNFPGKQGDYCAPCGVCRQVMREFCGSGFRIYLSKGDGTYFEASLEEMLPFSFSQEDLSK